MTIQANFPAIKPSLMLDFANTKQLDSRITYTRASTASYYDGVTTSKAEENLFTYSQEFDNAVWLKTFSTVTANSTAAPDGTTTADTLFETTSNGQHRVFISSGVTGTYTISAYAKAAGRDYVALWFGGVDKGKFFYIPAGGSGSVGNNFVNAPDSSSITYVGNDWYRCTVTVSGLSGSAQHINACLDATTFSYAGDVTKGVHIWGAQLEQRSAVTAYTATTTQAITNYIPKLQSAASGVARFDNNPTTGESLGLLIEESRTNLQTYSSQFDNGVYTKVNSATITTAANIAPDGTQTAQLFTNGATSSRIQTDITVTTATAYTATIYAKAGNASYLCFGFALAPNSSAIFNLSTGVVSNTAGSPTSTSITAVGNGWYRCSVTVTSTSTSIRLIAGASSTNTFSSVIYPNGTTGDTGFIWGAQLEAGAFATSYIPTVASQVTRAADAASMTGTNFSSWFNAGEGTLFSNSITPDTAAGFIITITDGTGNNQINTVSGAAGGGAFQVGVNGTLVVNTGTRQLNSKTAGAYKVNDFSVSTNGSAVSTDADGILPIVNRLDFGRRSDTTSFNINGTIKKFAYYPIRLSNTNLVALTS